MNIESYRLTAWYRAYMIFNLLCHLIVLIVLPVIAFSMVRSALDANTNSELIIQLFFLGGILLTFPHLIRRIGTIVRCVFGGIGESYLDIAYDYLKVPGVRGAQTISLADITGIALKSFGRRTKSSSYWQKYLLIQYQQDGVAKETSILISGLDQNVQYIMSRLNFLGYPIYDKLV